MGKIITFGLSVRLGIKPPKCHLHVSQTVYQMGVRICVQVCSEDLKEKSTSTEHSAWDLNYVQQKSALLSSICSRSEPNKAVPGHEGRWTREYPPARATILDRGSANWARGLPLRGANLQHGAVLLLLPAGLRAPLTSSPKALHARMLPAPPPRPNISLCISPTQLT